MIWEPTLAPIRVAYLMRLPRRGLRLGVIGCATDHGRALAQQQRPARIRVPQDLPSRTGRNCFSHMIVSWKWRTGASGEACLAAALPPSLSPRRRTGRARPSVFTSQGQLDPAPGQADVGKFTVAEELKFAPSTIAFPPIPHRFGDACNIHVFISWLQGVTDAKALNPGPIAVRRLSATCTNDHGVENLSAAHGCHASIDVTAGG